MEYGDTDHVLGLMGHFHTSSKANYHYSIIPKKVDNVKSKALEVGRVNF